MGIVSQTPPSPPLTAQLVGVQEVEREAELLLDRPRVLERVNLWSSTMPSAMSTKLR